MEGGSAVGGSETVPRRAGRVLAGVLLGIATAAIVLGTLLVVTHVAPGGSACGTVLAPREPSNDPLAGCPGTIAVRIVGAILSGVVAVACGAAAAVLIRRERHAAGSHRSASAGPPARREQVPVGRSGIGAPPRRAPRSRVLGLPSSTLGRVAGAAMLAAILLVVVANLVRTQGTDDVPAWQEITFVGALVGLLAADVLGLISVFRRHERSWIVLLPSTLITLAVVNELIQGALLFFGLAE